MEGTKKHLIAVVMSLLALVLLLFAFGSMMLRCTKDSYVPATIQPNNCDSLNTIIHELYIENGRYSIIMDRLYERDSTLYKEITSNLE